MESGKLRRLISNLCNGKYSPGELVEFIDVSQKIAISYLKYQESLGKNIRPKDAEGLNDLNDVAIDCIAGLFMRNEHNEFVQLKRYFNGISSSDRQLDLLMMLRRLIVKKTKQELSRIFRERDPEGAKIIRNIRVAIRNSDKFFAFKEMGREFVYMVRTRDKANLRRNCDGIPDKILAQQFSESYHPTDSVSIMMKKMLCIVAEDEVYQNYLPLDIIANLIRDVTFSQFKDQVMKNIDNSSPFHDLQLQEVNEVNQSVIRDIQNKIEHQYFKKDKISKEKADIYFKAISDFVQDLTQERACESNFKYLKKYLPEMSQQSYREEERSIFEYLVKVTKKSLRKKLKELL